MVTQINPPTGEIQRLNEIVARLAETVAQSERRQARILRTLRWGILAALLLPALVGVLVLERSGIAHARDPDGFPKATTAVEALNNINANLMVMGELGRTLQLVGPAIGEAVQSNPDVQAYVREYFEAHGLHPPPEQQDAYAQRAIVESVVGTFVDTVVLIQRIREDSNAFRDLITGPEDVLRDLEQQLKTMNVAMASIPAMVVQMDLMNRNMASMSHSMGSTMGRAGSWMPW